MKRFKLILGLLAVGIALGAVFLVLTSDKALLTHPKGIVASSELHLITTNVLLMLSVIIPTFILLLVTAWKYSAKNTTSEYDPEYSLGVLGELMLWAVPTVVVAVMVVITWYATYKLDPYRPLKTEVKPLTIQVVALDWKWLFIYPEQEIATVNFVQFPARTPIRFELSADNSPMNSFWIPQLSGQIYTMTGMVTSLHLMADGPGEYAGRAAEINGQGFADMTFVAKSCSPSDFDDWVQHVKKSPLQLTESAYQELASRTKHTQREMYSYVDKKLFH